MVTNESEKLIPYIKDIIELSIHIKEYKRTGKAHKYSVNSKVSFPGGTKSAKRANDWDPMKAVRKSLDELHRLVVKREKPFDRINRMKRREV
jgi:hypothetical protein